VRRATAEAIVREVERAADAGRAFPGIPNFAAGCGVSVATVTRALRGLEAARRIERQGYGCHIRYRVMPDGAWTARMTDAFAGWVPTHPADDSGVKVLGPTFTGKTVPWSESPLVLTPGALSVSDKVAITPPPKPDNIDHEDALPSVLRDRRESLRLQQYRIGLAIEHIDGLLHFLDPEGDGSEVEKKA